MLDKSRSVVPFKEIAHFLDCIPIMFFTRSHVGREFPVLNQFSILSLFVKFKFLFHVFFGLLGSSMPKEEPSFSEHSPCVTSSKNAKDKSNNSTMLAKRDTDGTDNSSGRGSCWSSEKDSGYSGEQM